MRCAGQVPTLESEQMVRKAKLATYAVAFPLMWPINQKRVFGACCAAVVWNRKRDGIDIELIPHSALEGNRPASDVGQWLG